MSIKTFLTSSSAGLMVGMFGLLMALISALGLNTGLFISDDWVAQVNGTEIPTSEYDRALLAMQDGLKRNLTEADRKKALQVLVDEELLLQAAENMGLTRSDPVVRKNLIQAMMKASTTLSETQPSEQQLKTFFAENQSLFSTPVIFSVSAAHTQSEKVSTDFILALQQGEQFTQAAQRLGLEPQNIPDQIPLVKLADYIGGDLARKLSILEDGEIAGPFIQNNIYKFYWLRKKNGEPRPFSATRDSVKVEWQRREAEKTFDAYLSDLRRTARIHLKMGFGK